MVHQDLITSPVDSIGDMHVRQTSTIHLREECNKAHAADAEQKFDGWMSVMIWINLFQNSPWSASVEGSTSWNVQVSRCRQLLDRPNYLVKGDTQRWTGDTNLSRHEFLLQPQSQHAQNHHDLVGPGGSKMDMGNIGVARRFVVVVLFLNINIRDECQRINQSHEKREIVLGVRGQGRNV